MSAHARAEAFDAPTAAPATVAAARGASGLLQRKCACGGASGAAGKCGDCERKKLNRSHSAGQSAAASAHATGHAASLVADVLGSAGQPLDAGTRALMETRLGHDFGHVRVHTGAQAAQSARAVGALAYTVGRQVVFDANQYQPSTSAGRRLLAHELTHVVQQGGDSRFQGKLEVGSPDSADEREADAAAAAFETGTGAEQISQSPARPGASPVLRRKTGGAGSWFTGLFSSLVLGTVGFPESWLHDYLKKLDETNDIEGDPDSDDKAREIVNAWRKGDSPFVLTARRKALLIHEMLDGPTMADDENAILELLERSYNFELSYIFGAGGVTGKRLAEDVPDDIGDHLREFYYRRFESEKNYESARDTVVAGIIRPQGYPVPLGVELPPAGAGMLVETKTFDPKGAPGWSVPCVLGLLCAEDASIVAQLPSLDVKTMERINVKKWTFDGKSWSHKVVHPAGVNKPDEKLVGVLKSSSCNSATQTLFHEVRHQNQTEDLRKTHFAMEVDAYTEQTKWAIKRGLPEERQSLDSPSLRKSDKDTGAESPNAEAIEKKVSNIYGRPKDETGQDADEGEIKGHVAPNKTILKLADDTTKERESRAGESYLEEPPTFVKAEKIDPTVWVCPKDKKP
jgi:hypothetical protein